MKIGILIPDRNDRPELLKNCMRMIARQTILPCVIEVVNYPAESEKCDITQRYRRGYDNLRNKGIDVIALIENDDWYAPDYLEYMYNQWIIAGKPALLGLDHTIYYHIRLFEHFTMHHITRSSAMNTFIRPELEIKWGHDADPYCDVHLWNQLKGVIITPEREICLGIKHGVGLCGGQNHKDKMARYINKDHDKDFLQSIMDAESFEFYSNYFPSANLT